MDASREDASDKEKKRPKGAPPAPPSVPPPRISRSQSGRASVPRPREDSVIELSEDSYVLEPEEPSIVEADGLIEFEDLDSAVQSSKPPPAPPPAPGVGKVVKAKTLVLGKASPSVLPPSMRPTQEGLAAELKQRAEAARAGADPVVLSRHHLEAGLAMHVAADSSGALDAYRAASRAASSALAPLVFASMLTPARPLQPALDVGRALVDAATDDALRAQRWIELARLQQSAGALEEASKAFRQALAVRPKHPEALRGLEGLLYDQLRTPSPKNFEALAVHLENMVSAWSEEPRFAAWLQVERAAHLDRVGKYDAARGALEMATRLDASSPAVRAAYTRHLLLRGSHEALVEAWASHADDDPDAARAARLEYAAARLASERLDDVNRAIELYERASARGAADVAVRRRALLELARLHTRVGNSRAVTEARERFLGLVDDPVRRAHEHRRLADVLELLGEHEDALRHAEQVLDMEPNDTDTRERLDRVLDELGRHDRRINVWAAEASRATVPSDRADAFVRAARIAEHEQKNPSLAESMYRAAWASDNAHPDAFDGLSRLLARPGSLPGQDPPEHARARIALYEQAAAATPDLQRRIAFLEKVAAIWEDELSMPARALEIYGRIEEIEPDRRSALVGRQRNAALAGEPDALLKALVRESDIVQDQTLRRALLLRAATVAADALNDTDTAISLVERVLSKSPGDIQALRTACRINQKTGRFEDALTQLRQLLKNTRRGPVAFGICLEIAVVLEERLRRPKDAVEAYREAAQLDPDHPVPPAEIARLLVSLGEFRQAAKSLVDLAGAVSNPYARAQLLLQAAEILDDQLGDLDGAVPPLVQAVALLPSDDSIFERLLGVQERRGKPGELVPLIEKRIVSTSGATQTALRFRLAALLDGERDQVRAASLLREVLEADSTHVGALRMLEHALRRLERFEELASVLRLQAGVFKLKGVRVGALFEAYFLEKAADATALSSGPTLLAILDQASDDPLVHEAVVRHYGVGVGGEHAVQVGRSLSTMAGAYEADDPSYAAALHLAAGLVHERTGAEDRALLDKALQHFSSCLERWPTCLSAGRGLLRVAELLDNESARVEALIVLGKTESERQTRALYVAAAAEAIAARDTASFPQAVEMFVQALAEDVDSLRAASGLIALLDRGADPARVADVLRGVLNNAKSAEQVMLVGIALGQVARTQLNDPTGAVEALRRVRDRSPGHVPTLLALAEACADLSLWFEAGEAARSAFGLSRDEHQRMRALVCLAEAHARVQTKWGEARREAVDAELASERLPAAERIAVSERLAKVYRLIDDAAEQERLVCMTVALAGDDPGPLHRLAELHDMASIEGTIAYVQSLNRVITMAEVLGVHRQPAWLVEIGRLESTRLSRPRDGVAKLRDAIRLDPGRLESTLALADTLATIGAHEEAGGELRNALLTGDPAKLDAARVATLAAMLTREFEAAGRNSQALVAEELMAFLGYGATERIHLFRTRSLPEHVPVAGALERTVLERAVVPSAGQNVFLRIAAALDEVSQKLLRVDPAALGASSQGRLPPRSTHPLRLTAERAARVFGPLQFDLYIDVPGLTVPRVLPGAPPALMIPPNFDKLPGPEQVAGFARLLAYVAMSVPWLDEVAHDDLDGILFGSLHAGRPGWDGGGLSPAREAMASAWKPRIAKAASRKTKKLLDELADEARLDLDPQAWRLAMGLASWRCAYIATGDWLATFNHAWRTDPQLARTPREQLSQAAFAHPVLRELIAFGLSSEAGPLLRVAGV